MKQKASGSWLFVFGNEEFQAQPFLTKRLRLSHPSEERGSPSQLLATACGKRFDLLTPP